ncbi:MAG: hypothetical protein LBC53_09770 [Spirochaetaceae bacterium]|jgi:hypothetical protein|nr:hypothetical protein [Spirochaetaceae bacterium]
MKLTDDAWRIVKKIIETIEFEESAPPLEDPYTGEDESLLQNLANFDAFLRSFRLKSYETGELNDAAPQPEFLSRLNVKKTRDEKTASKNIEAFTALARLLSWRSAKADKIPPLPDVDFGTLPFFIAEGRVLNVNPNALPVVTPAAAGDSVGFVCYASAGRQKFGAWTDDGGAATHFGLFETSGGKILNAEDWFNGCVWLGKTYFVKTAINAQTKEASGTLCGLNINSGGDVSVARQERANLDDVRKELLQAVNGLAERAFTRNEFRLRGLKHSDVYDGLDSEEALKPLSARQGKALAELISAKVTAEFAGPYPSPDVIPQPRRRSRLHLAGEAPPYDVYAYSASLKKLINLGRAEFRLENYYDKSKIDVMLQNLKEKAIEEARKRVDEAAAAAVKTAGEYIDSEITKVYQYKKTGTFPLAYNRKFTIFQTPSYNLAKTYEFIFEFGGWAHKIRVLFAGCGTQSVKVTRIQETSAAHSYTASIFYDSAAREIIAGCGAASGDAAYNILYEDKDYEPFLRAEVYAGSAAQSAVIDENLLPVLKAALDARAAELERRIGEKAAVYEKPESCTTTPFPQMTRFAPRNGPYDGVKIDPSINAEAFSGTDSYAMFLFKEEGTDKTWTVKISGGKDKKLEVTAPEPGKEVALLWRNGRVFTQEFFFEKKAVYLGGSVYNGNKDGERYVLAFAMTTKPIDCKANNLAIEELAGGAAVPAPLFFKSARGLKTSGKVKRSGNLVHFCLHIEPAALSYSYKALELLKAGFFLNGWEPAEDGEVFNVGFEGGPAKGLVPVAEAFCRKDNETGAQLLFKANASLTLGPSLRITASGTYFLD